ncbi:hypothetical protein WBJ53_02450 [Spirosoma sp. SC4-14]|uniref:hypothetical protein n=1 Tax=Spirosoma sp. SC4-14 TaxID=3128900 RepID=UPI0030CD83C2
MGKGIIRLSYRKVIDASSQKLWEKYVFEDTYMEFFMQAQSFNPDGQYSTFQELIEHIPNAEKLHSMTSRAAIGYIRQLNTIMPDIANQAGQLHVPFSQFNFEIIQSHVANKDAHKIAITFYSEPITWIDTIGNLLLVAYGDHREALKNGNSIDTDMIAIQSNLTITSFQESNNA